MPEEQTIKVKSVAELFEQFKVVHTGKGKAGKQMDGNLTKYWIARDMDGTLRAFKDEPIWDTEYEEDWQGEMICFVSDDENKFKGLACGEKIFINLESRVL